MNMNEAKTPPEAIDEAATQGLHDARVITQPVGQGNHTLDEYHRIRQRYYSCLHVIHFGESPQEVDEANAYLDSFDEVCSEHFRQRDSNGI